MEGREKKRERSPSSDGGRSRCSADEVKKGRVSHENDGNSKPSSPQAKSISPSKQKDNHLESARAEMGEVREENQRLKMYLERIMKDYKTLQMQFYDILKQDQANKISNSRNSNNNNNVNQETAIIADESDLVCLSLGRASRSHSLRKDHHHKNKAITSCDDKLKLGNGRDEKLLDKQDLALSLDCKFESSSKSSGTTESMPAAPPPNKASPTNSFEQDRKEDAGGTWPPSKVLKTMKGGTSGDDEVSQQNPAKKARVSVRARCDAPTMNDGCQWRKYGQKISKGNPCPRAYYRCTVAPSCPVRKQVQRCAEDMSILITTYEGIHNHPLPMSATAMASTTSAAASMLLSGSSSSQPGSGSSVMANSASSLHGLNFYLSDASKTKQFYLPNPSSISPSPPYPTITLDLTSNSFSYPSSSSFNGFSSTCPSARYSMDNNTSTSLSFSSSDASNTLPISWSNNGVLNYGSSQALYNRNQSVPTFLDIGRQTPQEGFCQSYFHKNRNPNATSSQEALPDTIAVATKAITTDPNFQTVLAAALKSIISNNGNNVDAFANQAAAGGGGGGNGDELGQKLRWSNESFPVANTQQVNGCASSYLNKSSAMSSQPGSLTFLPPALLPFSAPKSAAASPRENRDRSGS